MKKYLYLLAAFLTFMIIGFSPPKVASASGPPEYAYHWGIDDNGEVAKKVEERFQNLVNQHYKTKFHANFNFGNPKLYIKDHDPIKLNETIEGAGGVEYLRYYFWLGDDNKSSDGKDVWRTLYYNATEEVIGDGKHTYTYDASGGEKCPRLFAQKVEGSFYGGSKDTPVDTMSFYVVDMKQWLEKFIYKDTFNETCYLQSVIGHIKKGAQVSSDMMNMQAWCNECSYFEDVNLASCIPHYNYKVRIKRATPSNFTVHWKQWKTGDSKSDDKVDGLQDMEVKKKGDEKKDKDPEKVNEGDQKDLFKSANTCLALSHLNSESYTKDGYYVKGIVLLSRAEKGGKIVSHKHYWITDSLSELGEVEDKTEVNHSYKGADSGADKDTFWTGSGGLAVQDIVQRAVGKNSMCL